MIAELVQLYDPEIQELELVLLYMNEAITHDGGAWIYA
jgi:hypothetical protein